MRGSHSIEMEAAPKQSPEIAQEEIERLKVEMVPLSDEEAEQLYQDDLLLGELFTHMEALYHRLPHTEREEWIADAKRILVETFHHSFGSLSQADT